MKFVAAILMALGMMSGAQAATVTGAACFNNNVYSFCATGIEGLQLSTGKYDVGFLRESFRSKFPVPTDYMFWGDYAGALEAGEAISSVFTGSGVGFVGTFEVIGDSYYYPTDGFGILYEPLSDYASDFVARGVYITGGPGTPWTTFSASSAITEDAKIYIPIFNLSTDQTSASDIPTPATLALLGLGLVGIAHHRSSRSTGKEAAR